MADSEIEETPFVPVRITVIHYVDEEDPEEGVAFLQGEFELMEDPPLVEIASLLEEMDAMVMNKIQSVVIQINPVKDSTPNRTIDRSLN